MLSVAHAICNYGKSIIHFMPVSFLTLLRLCYKESCSKEDPLSQEGFRKLAEPLPFSKLHHSKLVCYITKELMDHENPPLVLPNGYVYSTKVWIILWALSLMEVYLHIRLALTFVRLAGSRRNGQQKRRQNNMSKNWWGLQLHWTCKGIYFMNLASSNFTLESVVSWLRCPCKDYQSWFACYGQLAT